MKKVRPHILSIAGFDPTGGAGVLADVKTSERLRCYAMAVITANTVQTAQSVHAVNWLPIPEIKQQLQALEAIDFSAIKIGIVQHPEMLTELVYFAKQLWPKAFLVWDPVIKASDGKTFMNSWSLNYLEKALQKIDLITPNLQEIELLTSDQNVEALTKFTNVFVTGGHNVEKIGTDEFHTPTQTTYYRPKPNQTYSEKHGSGCILSTAIACHIALGYSTHMSLLKSKRYIERALKSNSTLLAYHYN